MSTSKNTQPTGKPAKKSAAASSRSKGQPGTPPRDSSKRSARDRMAEERERQAEVARRKERLVRGLVAGLVVVAIVIVAVVVQATRDSKKVVYPASASKSSIGYVLGSPTASSTVPDVVLHEDFQCPVCEQFESVGTGKVLSQLAAEKKIKLTYIVRSFLDGNLGNDASLRAASAAACADQQGKFIDYHNQVYANPPAKEGAGFTDAQLLSFGKTVGLTGSDFTSCVKDVRYKPYVNWVERQGVAKGVSGTPTMLVNGKTIKNATDANKIAPEFTDQAALLKTLGVSAPAADAAAATSSPTPSATPAG